MRVDFASFRSLCGAVNARTSFIITRDTGTPAEPWRIFDCFIIFWGERKIIENVLTNLRTLDRLFGCGKLTRKKSLNKSVIPNKNKIVECKRTLFRHDTAPPWLSSFNFYFPGRGRELLKVGIVTFLYAR